MSLIAKESVLTFLQQLKERIEALELFQAPPPGPVPPPDPPPTPTRALKVSITQDHANPDDLDGSVLDPAIPYWVWLAATAPAPDQVVFELDDVTVNTVLTENAAGEWWYAGEGVTGGATPVVQATNTSGESSVQTTHDISLPTGLTTNDLMVVNFGFRDDPGTVTWPANWIVICTQLSGGTPPVYNAWACKRFGAEGATIQVTTTNAKRSSHNSYRISGAADPAVTPPEGGVAIGATPAPNPPSKTASGGDRNYLVLCGGTIHEMSPNAAPANYTNFLNFNTSEGTGEHVSAMSARRALAVGDDNPAAFGTANTLNRRWCAATIFIYPTSTGAGGHQSVTFAVGSRKIDAVVTEV